MPTFEPGYDSEIDQTNTSKLVRGMLFFVIALLLIGLFFFGLWLWLGDQGRETASNTAEQQQPAQEQQEPPTKTQEAPLQGPDEGQLVAPPTRDVTPNYQLSPLHQTKPLTRTAGSPLPPAPKQDPLPQIFRHVVVENPTELELTVSHNRVVPVRLAHLNAPNAQRMCWFAGQKVPCLAMGKTALRRFIRARAIGCDWIAKTEQPNEPSNDTDDNSGRQAARCYLGPGLKDRKAGGEPKGVTDLASWLVRFGWAEPENGFYGDERQEAIGLKRGIHATQDSSGGAQILARQQEIRALSATNEQAADGIEASSSLNDEEAPEALTLMAPPVIEKEKELQLPPGFE
ncbi:hypothetical protein [Cohaesibacter celericrescens]|uniref:hypothetical protein n=1 Tax=Cohaesibacter celericrescens TaxID=2067669 RepID=UPI003563864A